jgi:hypothetical protein
MEKIMRVNDLRKAKEGGKDEGK